MKEEVPKLATFGRGGDTLYMTGNCTCSGYGSPERPHAAEDCERHRIPEGMPAINLLPAIQTDEGFRWAIRGPMVDVNLDDGEVDECPTPSPMLAGAVADNQYGTLLAMQEVSRHKKEKRGPLDQVSISEFIQGWREHGAIIGRFENGCYVWEE